MISGRIAANNGIVNKAKTIKVNIYSPTPLTDRFDYFVVADNAIVDSRAGAASTVDSAAFEAGRVAANSAVGNRWAAVVAAVDSAASKFKAICNYKACKYGISIFTAVEVEAAASVVAVDYCCSDYVRGGWVNALDGDSFAGKINIVVAGTAVYTGEDKDKVAVGRIVDCRLNVIKIIRPIVINDDYFRLRWDGQKQANKDKNQIFHFRVLLCQRLPE